MQNEKVRRILTDASASLDQVKSALFDASRECVNGENGSEWNIAKTIIDLAESADSLKRQLKSLANGAEPAAVTIEARSTRHAAEPGRESERPGRKRKEDYPKYSVHGDRLVKVGLGRDRRTEYEHEVPREEFDKILGQLTSLSRTQSRFVVEELIKTMDCPAYQIYIVIAVLTRLGFLVSPRRGTYKFVTPGTFPSVAVTAWDKLQGK
jgi:hypothetical protein